MKPVVLPMLHLVRVGQNWQRLTGNVSLLRPRYSEHAFVFVREDFDEAPNSFVPVFQDPLGALASGQLHVTTDQIANHLYVASLEERLKIDRLQIASTFSEVAVLVEDIGDSTAHARSEVSAATAEDDH